MKYYYITKVKLELVLMYLSEFVHILVIDDVI